MAKKELRYYQQAAIDSVKKNLENGVKSQLLVLCTGAGKSMLAVKLIEQMQFKRVLWLSHSDNLITQSALGFITDKFGDEFATHVEEIGFTRWASSSEGLFKRFETSYKVGIIKAEHFVIDADVVMGSAQTVYRRIDRIPKDYFDLIVTDEAHLFGSKSFVAPLQYFTPKLLLGLTATPHRESGVLLSDIFDKIAYSYDIGDAIKEGYLCELDAIRVKTDLSLDKVKSQNGDFNLSDLSDEVDIPERNSLIVDSYLQYANGRQGIFFCVDIEHSINLAAEFRSRGLNCEAVSSDEKRTGNQREKIKKFKSGEIQILTNAFLLVAGFDHKNVGVVGNCSPTKSITRYLQAIGRATRLKDEEYVSKFGQQAVILDFVDNTTKHKLVNAWTLDSGKATEEKVFITKQKKLDLIGERERRKAFVQKTSTKDIKVDLLELPKVNISFASDRWREPATEAQLSWLRKENYDVVNVAYTKQQASEILSNLSASTSQIALLKHKGFDVSNGVTIAEFKKAMAEIEKKEQQTLISKYTPSNDGKPFF
jgi:superfamily II DNA or RNA helicase